MNATYITRTLVKKFGERIKRKALNGLYCRLRTVRYVGLLKVERYITLQLSDNFGTFTPVETRKLVRWII
jgi:hypothetical protein